MIKIYIAGCTKATEHSEAQKLAAKALQETFGCDLQILKDAHGKPYVSQDGIYLSIAHSHERCLVAVSDSEIGADLEYRYAEEDRLIRLAERYFTKEEAEYVRKKTCDRFYEIWCAKESYIKYTGDGFSRPLSSFCTFDLPLQFSHFDTDGYTVCICSKEKADIPPIYVK